MTSNDAAAADAVTARGRYELPPQAGQVMSVYTLQMRLYAKSWTPYLLILLAALIPISMFILDILSDGPVSDILDPEIVFVLLPYMIALIPAVFAGRVLSSEFKNRTAYLTFPLPVTRTVFFIGKLMAAMTLSLSIMLLGFGLGIVMSDVYGIALPDDTAMALMLSLFGIFAITAMAYALSAVFKRGSVAATIAIVIVLPLVLEFILLIVYLVTNISEETLDGILDILHIMPVSVGNVALGMIAGNGSPFAPAAYMIAATAWGIAFILLGWFLMNRKEL
ncbi:MAG: ABC transporter permease [Methanomassiliicoccaceae archaeon]|nr:ABC transporter permease [Methanomassiliicoccaceae archaeon]